MILGWLLASALVGIAEAPPAATAPAWVREAMASGAPATAAPAVVLLDQVEMTVAADGRVRTNRRYAVRLQDRAGREAAALREVYVTGTGRIRTVRAWLVRVDGSVRELGDRDAVDSALVNNDVFNEVRVRRIDAVESVAPGDVFAAEVESDDQLLFAQVEWHMQGRWPARVVRRVLTLPAGWRADSLTFNAPTIAPRHSAGSSIWESRDVPALPDEDGMPPITDLAARVAVSISGSAQGTAPGQFGSWADVSSWLDALAARTAHTAPVVAGKARLVTAPAATQLERVGAIARHVQRVQYVSIQTGVGRGGGYAPRPPEVVLERNYGDCKDKAALMRAMLAAIGIRSHFVAVFSGDRNYVREAWPSPQQFNHVVLGIAMDEMPAGAVSTVDHPGFGRLLLFDPTDEHLRPGELPLHLQGSLGLIVAPNGGALVRIPLAPASYHAIAREIDGTLSGAGTLSASLRERSTGAYAATARAEHLTLGPSRFQANLEHRLGAGLPGARVTRLAVEEDGASLATFVVTAALAADGFAQAQAGLLVVPLPFESGGRFEIPASQQRRTPLLLEARLVTERVRLQLPPGYALDEIPQATTLETPFGRYSVTYTADGGYLSATRSLNIPLQTVRPDQYSAARNFFDGVRTADQSPVVLVRSSR